MKPKANYLKQVFGQLKVIECVEESNGHNKGGTWVCMCKCRKMITLKGYQLHSRDSCGCLKRKAVIAMGKANRKSDKEKAITKSYREYRKIAQEPVSKEKWIIMMEFSCHYCDAKTDHIETEIEESVGGYSRRDITIYNNCKTIKGKLKHKEFVEYIMKVSEKLRDIQ